MNESEKATTQTEECPLCGGTGWLDCEAAEYCVDDNHGTFCSCPEGKNHPWNTHD